MAHGNWAGDLRLQKRPKRPHSSHWSSWDFFKKHSRLLALSCFKTSTAKQGEKFLDKISCPKSTLRFPCFTESTEIVLITLFVHIDDLCKENRWDFHHDLGRKFGLHFSEVWTIYAAFQLSGMRHFNRFYDGLYGKWLRPYFPKMPSYSVFLRRLQLREAVVGDFQSFTQAILNFFIVDSTPFELCKIVRSWRSCLFEEHADWAISATKKIYGIKLHLAIDDLNQVVNFFITKGSTSDVSMAAKLLQGRTGTAIGDKGYVSKNLHMELKNCGLNFIARAKRNMKEQNTAEEIAALSKRYKVKIFTGKLKTRLGDNVAHFRPWKAVSAAIGIGLMTMNLGF